MELQQKPRKSKKIYLLFFLALVQLLLVSFMAVTKDSGSHVFKRLGNVLSMQTTGLPRAYILPDSATLSSNTKFTIWVERTNSTAFAELQLYFSKGTMKLSKDISIVGPLTRVIKKTSPSEANKTGVINIVVALDPSNISRVPDGSFPIAELYFEPIPQWWTSYVQLKYDGKKTHLYSLIGNTQLLSTTSTKITVPGRTVVPSTTPAPTPVSSVTATPIPTPTPTPTPTIVSCDSFCKSADYRQGSCWGSENLCVWNKGTYFGEGDKYCTTVDPSCCCVK